MNDKTKENAIYYGVGFGVGALVFYFGYKAGQANNPQTALLAKNLITAARIIDHNVEAGKLDLPEAI